MYNVETWPQNGKKIISPSSYVSCRIWEVVETDGVKMTTAFVETFGAVHTITSCYLTDRHMLEVEKSRDLDLETSHSVPFTMRDARTALSGNSSRGSEIPK